MSLSTPKAYQTLRTTSFILLLIGTVMAAVMSPSLLWRLDYDYITSAAMTLHKINPSTYIIFIALAIWVIDVGVIGLGRHTFSEMKDVGYYFSAVTFFFLYNSIFIGGQFSTVIDSFYCPGIFVLLARTIDEPRRKRMAVLVHLIMLVNALVGLRDYLTGSPLLSLIVTDAVNQGVTLDVSDWGGDGRSSGILGHPLWATCASSIYILTSLANLGRTPITFLQLITLVASIATLPIFGGRFSIFLFCAFIAFMFFRSVAIVAKGGKISGSFLVVFTFGVVAIILISIFAVQFGYFDTFVSRVNNDGGSADTRLFALEVLSNSSISEILFGDVDETLFRKLVFFGTATGIETFWISFILRYGLICSSLVFPALVCLARQMRKDLGYPATLGMTFFLIAISGFLAISAKTTEFSYIVAMIYALTAREGIYQFERDPKAATPSNRGLFVEQGHGLTQMHSNWRPGAPEEGLLG